MNPLGMLLEQEATMDLDELRERMVHAEELLHNLAAHTKDEREQLRRAAKAEGVRLCLSYLDELEEAS